MFSRNYGTDGGMQNDAPKNDANAAETMSGLFRDGQFRPPTKPFVQEPPGMSQAPPDYEPPRYSVPGAGEKPPVYQPPEEDEKPSKSVFDRFRGTFSNIGTDDLILIAIGVLLLLDGEQDNDILIMFILAMLFL